MNSDSDFEKPQATSTQVKKHKMSAPPKSEFLKKLFAQQSVSKTADLVSKSDALRTVFTSKSSLDSLMKAIDKRINSKKPVKGILKSPKNASLAGISKLPKLNKFDDESSSNSADSESDEKSQPATKKVCKKSQNSSSGSDSSDGETTRQSFTQQSGTIGQNVPDDDSSSDDISKPDKPMQDKLSSDSGIDKASKPESRLEKQKTNKNVRNKLQLKQKANESLKSEGNKSRQLTKNSDDSSSNSDDSETENVRRAKPASLVKKVVHNMKAQSSSSSNSDEDNDKSREQKNVKEAVSSSSGSDSDDTQPKVEKKNKRARSTSSSSSDDQYKSDNKKKLSKKIHVQQQIIISENTNSPSRIATASPNKKIDAQKAINKSAATVSESDSSSDTGSSSDSSSGSSSAEDHTLPKKTTKSPARPSSGSSDDSEAEEQQTKPPKKSKLSTKSKKSPVVKENPKDVAKRKNLNWFTQARKLEKAENPVDLSQVITSDDEVYFLKVTKNLDLLSMKDMKLSLDTPEQFMVGTNHYKSTVTSDQKPLTILDVTSLKNIHVAGCTTINQDHGLDELSQTLEFDIADESIQFPTELLKERHPLFGADYKQLIKLDPQVNEKLNNLIDNLQTKYKKPKASKSEAKVEDEDIFKILNLHTSMSKEEKRKNKTVELAKAKRHHSTDEPVKKKKKKNKSELEASQSVDEMIEALISEPSTDEPVKKRKKKNKSELEATHSVDMMGSLKSEPMVVVKTEPHNSTQEPMKKKKKKRDKSKLEVTDLVDSSINLQVSGAKSEHTKKKKSDLEKDKNVTENDFVTEPLHKKKKKKRKSESFAAENKNSLIINSTLINSPSVGLPNFNLEDSQISVVKPKKSKKSKKHKEGKPSFEAKVSDDLVAKLQKSEHKTKKHKSKKSIG